VTETVSSVQPSPDAVVPTAMSVIDLETPSDVRFPVRQIAAHHVRMRAMVRRQRRPLGFVDVPASGGRWDQQALDAALAEIDAARREPAGSDVVAGPRAGTGWDPGSKAEPAARVDALSVVVCTRDRAELLRRCLTSVLDQAGPHTDVVVVDNAPKTAATRAVVEDLADPRLTYVLEPRPGLSVARNCGIARARHDLVAYTDDVVADPHWLSELATAAALGDAGCVTGAVPTAELESEVQHFFERRISWAGQLEAQLFSRGDDRGALYPFSSGIFGTGANFAVTKAAYAAVGPFDERLGAGRRTRGGEDLDYFFRLIWAGVAIRYEPSALVWHVHRPDAAAYRDQVLGLDRARGQGAGGGGPAAAVRPRATARAVGGPELGPA
jgi:GT2 family glycosyltransferase